MNRTRLLIGSVGVIILSAVVFTWMRYRENELLRSGPTPAFVGERINNWRNAKFEKVPLTAGEFVSRMGEVKLSGNDLLSEIQKVGLHSILGDWMRCYSEGTFEAYQRFRLDYPHRFDFQKSMPLVEHLKTYEGVDFGVGDRAKLELLWERKNTLKLPEVAFESMQVEVRRVERVASEADLIRSTSLRYLPRSCVLISLVSPVVYAENPDTIVGQKQPLTYAIASIVFRMPNQNQIMPVTALFYWAPGEQRWHPWHLAYGQVEKMDVLKFSLWF